MQCDQWDALWSGTFVPNLNSKLKCVFKVQEKLRTDTKELSGPKLRVPYTLPMTADFLVSCFCVEVVEGLKKRAKLCQGRVLNHLTWETRLIPVSKERRAEVSCTAQRGIETGP